MTLVADIRGGGPPVVLLHGQPGTAADWAPVVGPLSLDHTVIVPDRPGYGRTGGPAVGFMANADAVVALLDRLAVTRAVVVGHSWAGGVAIALAERAPGRLIGAVLLAPVVPVEPPGRLDRLLALPLVAPVAAGVALSLAGRAMAWSVLRHRLGRAWGTADEHLGAMAESWRRRQSWRSFAVEQRALVAELPSLAPGLAAISVPVTILIGDADRVVAPDSAERLAAAVPGAAFERLAGAGHLLALERPDAVVAAVAAMAR